MSHVYQNAEGYIKQLEKENAAFKKEIEEWKLERKLLEEGNTFNLNLISKLNNQINENAALNRLYTESCKTKESLAEQLKECVGSHLSLEKENKALKESLKNLELQINRKIIPTSI